MQNDKLLIHKQEAIITNPEYMIPAYCCQNNQYVINFTNNDMISKFEAFTKNKLDK